MKTTFAFDLIGIINIGTKWEKVLRSANAINDVNLWHMCGSWSRLTNCRIKQTATDHFKYTGNSDSLISSRRLAVSFTWFPTLEKLIRRKLQLLKTCSVGVKMWFPTSMCLLANLSSWPLKFEIPLPLGKLVNYSIESQS